MEDIQQQLAALRQRIARVDRKWSKAPPAVPPRPPERIRGEFIDELLSGEVVTTPHGRHFETEKLWENHRRHGSVYISDLGELPEDLLDPLSDGAIARTHPTRWAFLDTETTGLAGGTGTYAFLIGVGSLDAQGFRLRQFFMRDYGEEASLLHRLSEHLAQFDVLITYNGKSYDQPLLETRFRMARAAIRSIACSTWISCSARAACGSCGWKAAGWWTWRAASSVSSARAICPAR